MIFLSTSSALVTLFSCTFGCMIVVSTIYFFQSLSCHKVELKEHLVLMYSISLVVLMWDYSLGLMG